MRKAPRLPRPDMFSFELLLGMKRRLDDISHRDLAALVRDEFDLDNP